MFSSYIVSEKCKYNTNLNSNENENDNMLNTPEKEEILIEYMDLKNINENESLLSRKKKLKDLIKNLNRFELIEIFNIFKEEKCSFSENTNGIFINITNVEEEVINKVYKFIEYIEEKKKDLKVQEEIIEEERERIKDINKLNEENYENYIFNQNFIHQIQENKTIEVLSEPEEEVSYQLDLSSGEENDDENKFVNKKKKIKYTGSKARILKSYKDSKDNNTTSKKKHDKDKDKDENENNE